MNNVHKQCQIQLELERVTITNRLQRPKPGNDIPDTVEWQVLQRLRDKLQSVEHALKRLAEGRFGTCQECRHPIEAERLLTLPTAELCIDCQRRLERRTIGQHRLRRMSNAALG